MLFVRQNLPVAQLFCQALQQIQTLVLNII
jgi:hypothetical protein